MWYYQKKWQLELFKPFIFHKLDSLEEWANTVKAAKKTCR